jgi:hypothetical protein
LCILQCHPSGTFHSLHNPPFMPLDTANKDPDESSCIARLEKLRRVMSSEDLT